MGLGKKSVFFKFRNSWIRVQSESTTILENILFDFRPFQVEAEAVESLCHVLTLNLDKDLSPLVPPLLAISWRGKKFWGWGRHRYVLYPGYGHLRMEVDARGRKHLQFHFMDEEELRTQVLLCFQALWGEDSESEGLIRLHALSVGWDEGAKVFMADSGSGKSHFALKILSEREDLVLLSDETAWISAGVVFPFPTPLALNAKVVGPIANLVEGHPMKRGLNDHKRIFQQQGSLESKKRQRDLNEIIYFSSHPSIIERNFWRLLFIGKLTLGYQLPQMVELFLRTDSIFLIFKTLVRRLGFALKILIQNRVRPVFDRDHLSEIEF